MSAIRCIYFPDAQGKAHDPGFPATDQHPLAIRYSFTHPTRGALLVDALDGLPTQAEIDAVLNPIAPDVSGFLIDLKAAMGGPVASNALARQYPNFYPSLQIGAFADSQALIIDAHATAVLTDAQYASMKSLAAKHNIPVTLP